MAHMYREKPIVNFDQDLLSHLLSVYWENGDFLFNLQTGEKHVRELEAGGALQASPPSLLFQIPMQRV